VRFKTFIYPKCPQQIIETHLALRALAGEPFRRRTFNAIVAMGLVEEVNGRLQEFFQVLEVDDDLMLEFPYKPSAENAVVGFNFSTRLGVSSPAGDAVHSQGGQSGPESQGIVDGMAVAIDLIRQAPTRGGFSKEPHGGAKVFGVGDGYAQYGAAVVVENRQHNDAGTFTGLKHDGKWPFGIELPDLMRGFGLKAPPEACSGPRAGSECR
jgi:hypothetical protein